MSDNCMMKINIHDHNGWRPEIKSSASDQNAKTMWSSANSNYSKLNQGYIGVNFDRTPESMWWMHE